MKMTTRCGIPCGALLLLVIGAASAAEPIVADAEGVARLREWEQKPVPSDSLQRCLHGFQPVTPDALRKALITHAEKKKAWHAEHIWGDGYGRQDEGWTGHPIYRNVAYFARGYLVAARLVPERAAEFRGLAREAIDYLVAEQAKEGGYIWWYGPAPKLDRSNSLYDSGEAAHALIRGYFATQDQRYLAASERVGRFMIECPVSRNNNYNAFAVKHFALHYTATRDEQFLNSAVQKARDGILPRQLPWGGWPGHNSSISYHGVMMVALLELYRVLPQDHAFQPQLRGCIVRGMNHMRYMQNPEGHFHRGWEYDHEGFHIGEDGRPRGNNFSCGERQVQAWALADAMLDADDAILWGMARYLRSSPNRSDLLSAGLMLEWVEGKRQTAASNQ